MDFISWWNANLDIVSLVIFGLCVILFVWDKLPMATSAILGCAMMVLLGVCDFDVAFGQFASSTVIMLIAVLAVGQAVSETGVAAKIGEVIMVACKNNERALIAVSFVLAFILSTFMTNVTVLAIFIPIIFGLGKENKNINPLNIVIPITLAVNMGGITTLVGSSQQMTAQGLLEEYGYPTFGVFDFTIYGVILGIVVLLYCLFIGYPMGIKIWGNRDNSDAEANQMVRQDVVLERRKVISISVIFVLMVVLYITQRIPFTNIEVPVHLTAVLAALACIITGCIDQKKVVTNINWNIVGRLAACLGLAKALQSAGGVQIVADAFMNFVGDGMNVYLLFAVVVLFSQVLSLFISNSTSISVTLLIIMAIAPALNLNVQAFALGIVFGSSMGCCCPLSGSTWGISMSAGYKFRDYFRYGILVDAIGYLLVIILVPLFMGLTV